MYASQTRRRSEAAGECQGAPPIGDTSRSFVSGALNGSVVRMDFSTGWYDGFHFVGTVTGANQMGGGEAQGQVNGYTWTATRP